MRAGIAPVLGRYQSMRFRACLNMRIGAQDIYLYIVDYYLYSCVLHPLLAVIILRIIVLLLLSITSKALLMLAKTLYFGIFRHMADVGAVSKRNASLWHHGGGGIMTSGHSALL